MKYKIENLNQEFTTAYKEFFESKLAVIILKNPQLFPAVKKVSVAILELIITNYAFVAELVKTNEVIHQELFSNNFFGHLTKPQDDSKIVELIIDTLENYQDDLAKTLQIHAIFIQRVFDKLPKKNSVLTSNELDNIKQNLVKMIFIDDFFNPTNRGRIDSKILVKTTKQLGITKNKVFCKMVGESKEDHIRATEKFLIDQSSTIGKIMSQKCIPFAAGISGHTGSLLLGAKLYGKLDEEELKEYALASFGFLAGGGNHSFNEVMIVANRVGVEFELGKYEPSLPISFKTATVFEKFKIQFSEFFQEPVSPSPFV